MKIDLYMTDGELENERKQNIRTVALLLYPYLMIRSDTPKMY